MENPFRNERLNNDAGNNHFETRCHDARRELEPQRNAVEKDFSTITNNAIVLGKCIASVVALSRCTAALDAQPTGSIIIVLVRTESIGNLSRLCSFVKSCCNPFIASSTWRLASRVLMNSRRTCCFAPLVNPSSTLARLRRTLQHESHSCA